MRLFVVLVVAVGLLGAGCGPTLIEAPYTPPVEPGLGARLPFRAWVAAERRNVEGKLDALLTRDTLAPPEGIRVARETVVRRLADAGLFESVNELEGPVPPGAEGIVLDIKIDIVIGVPSFGTHSFNPHAYVTVRHVGPGGARQTLLSSLHFETRGVVGDNPFAIHEVVMTAWRAGANAIASQIANTLPAQLTQAMARVGLTARAPAAPEPRHESEPRPAPAAASGSGFLLRNTNLVLTNYHVVADRSQITLVFPNGEEYQGRVAFRDRSNDLALIEARGLAGTARGLVVAVNAPVKVGETVHAVGYPLGAGLSRQPSMVSGAVSSTVGLDDDIARFRTTAPINPGNSGGPIVNARGQVIGIAVAGLVRQGVEAIRFGIKASTAALILQQAQVTTAFDIGVGPAEGAPGSPEQVFEKVSPHVVLIETR